ncbi:cytochrome c1 [Rhodobacteraceae bacterium]|nr:cytochrome c1 [Paracoccaceae bacterium]
MTSTPATASMMSRRLMIQLAKTLRVMVLGVAGSLALGAMPLYAGPDDGAITNIPFSFEGPFGTYDQQQLRRGFQVYREVCAACHGLQYVPLRSLSDPDGLGMNPDWVRAYAGQMFILDPHTGEERPRKETDAFPARNEAGMGPDLSLMAKSRAGFHGPYGLGLSQLVNGTGGPEYIYSLLTGYTGAETDTGGAYLYENRAIEGAGIAMPPPFYDGQIIYADGTPATPRQMSMDVAAFLMWTAEPKLVARKRWGVVAISLLCVLALLLYLMNRRLWAPYKPERL